jgi:2,3-bisphosphoglycerate-independent phosphoglycerate mutase
VPLVLVSNDLPASLRPDGSLQDISPTILGILGVREPIEMTGHDLRIARP